MYLNAVTECMLIITHCGKKKSTTKKLFEVFLDLDLAVKNEWF